MSLSQTIARLFILQQAMATLSMFSPLNTASPASPTLSHGSSSFDEIDNWLDLPQGDSQLFTNSAMADKVAIQDVSSTNEFDMGELFRLVMRFVPYFVWRCSDLVVIRQYMANDKALDNSMDFPNATPSTFFPSLAAFDPTASFDPSLSIDPLLVETSSGSSASVYVPSPPAPAPLKEEEYKDVEMLQDETDDLLAPLPEDVPAPQVKAAAPSKAKGAKGKGRVTRSSKPSVADLVLPGSSITSKNKPTASTSNKIDPASTSHILPHIVFPCPSYIDKPDDEEYSKMSSKEKRQMRNKISARNFRHRRKGQ